MPDTKITALAAITTVDPAADVLPIVDISDTSMAASGTTKKITSNQILGAGGTATLASATITGDLTVDTNTLYVNSSTDRVSIGTLSALGSAKLSIAGKTQADTAVAGDVIGNFNNTSATGYGFRIGGGSATGGYALSVNNNAGSEFHQISGTGIATWSNVGGVAGTAMTLNATGLGVGDSPSYKLHVARTADGTVGYFRRIGATINPALTVYCNETGNTVGFGTDYAGATSPAITFTTAGTVCLRIDSSANVISNVTGTAPTLATNSQMVFNLTSNTNLRISVRGTDGTTRTANITLA